MSLKIGALLDERYRIVARIGHGGMAEVYEASDIINKKKVAVKLIREDAMANPINLRRFQNEATIAASLSHPNIVRVIDHGYFEDRPYIINEYIDGQTLKDALDFRNSFSILESVSIMLQLTAALYYAHQHGIVHRDVKPQNIFILSDGTIKLNDFGISESENITKAFSNDKEIIGSVHYLAPEISSGKPATEYSDIYAAGVTFFELITGRVPFSSGDAINIVVAHINEKFPSPRNYVSSCPKEIEKIIFKACAKDPYKRYSDAKEFNDELREIYSHPELFKEKKSFLSRIFGFK